MPIRITPARRPGDIKAIRLLLRAYFDQLVAQFGLPVPDPNAIDLPGQYAPPGGAMLVAWRNRDDPIGCVFVRPLPRPGACELKRLYVSPNGRNTGASRDLLSAAIEAATAAGHRTMLLDTHPDMTAAIALYARAGFVPAASYPESETPGLLCFARPLGA